MTRHTEHEGDTPSDPLDPQLLQAMVDAAEDAVVVVDGTQRIRYVNGGAERLFAWQRADLIGRPLDVLIPAQTRASHADRVREFERAQSVSRTMGQRARVQGKRSDGSTFPAEITIAKHRRGDERALIAIVRDVSERQSHEDRFEAIVRGTARARGEAFFSALVRAVGGALGVRYVHVGQFHERSDRPVVGTLGVWSEGAIASNFEYDVVPGSICHALLREGRTLEVRSDERFELSFADRVTFAPRACLGVSLTDSAGGPLGNIIVASDVPVPLPRETMQLLSVFAARAGGEIERLREVRALERSEADVSSILEGAPVGFVRAGAAGEILRANGALARMLGYETVEALVATDTLRHELSERFLFTSSLAAGGVLEREAQWHRRDGALLQVRLRGRHVPATDDRPACIELFVADVTDRRALEESLRQAQKMEAVGQLTGGIAHDLNNLLTIIQCGVSALQTILPDAREDVMEELQSVEQATRRGAEMIRKLLAFGRRARLDKQPHDPIALLHESLELVERFLPREVRVVRELPASLPPISVDAGALQHILLNIAKNASDAMPSGGTLHVSASVESRQRLREPSTPAASEALANATRPSSEAVPMLRIELRDSGTGMDAATLVHAFEPFFTTKALGEGSGLGLAMVYGLMKQHEGTIELLSAIGRGTTVVLHFPLADESAGRVVASTPRRDAILDLRGGSETILLVEDEPGIRDSARRVLEERGYAVRVASNGLEALALIMQSEGQLDLVVSDVSMPEMGGVGFVAELRRRECGIPVILTSGYMNRPEAESATADRFPCVDFLPKPWSGADLLERVRAALDGSRVPARLAQNSTASKLSWSPSAADCASSSRMKS